MNIVFYAYGLGHLFIEELLKNEYFSSFFNQPNVFIVTDNRTHKYFYDSKGWDVLYLSDFEEDKRVNYPLSDNFMISMKRYTLIDLKAVKQEQVFSAYKNLIEDFLKKNDINLVLYERKIQSMEGTLILNTAKSLNIKTICPHFGRIYGRSFLSNSEQEYFTTFNTPSREDEKEAQIFLTKFKKAGSFLYPLFEKTKISKHFQKNLITRTFNYFVRHLKYCEMFERQDFFQSINNNLPFINSIKIILRRLKSKKYFNKINYEELPENYVYFPLHVTPEASTSIHAPYFKDQLRALDMIRLSIPPNFKVIVKEHPMMKGIRPLSFYKEISKMAGVRLVSHELSSFKLIKGSRLVITITGTAAFEAYLLAIPSFTIVEAFFSNFTNTLKIDFLDFKETIKTYINKKIKEEYILKDLAIIYANTNEYNPMGVEANPGIILSKRNMESFVKEVIFTFRNYESKFN